jgi:hypothetical protein
MTTPVDNTIIGAFQGRSGWANLLLQSLNLLSLHCSLLPLLHQQLPQPTTASVTCNTCTTNRSNLHHHIAGELADVIFHPLHPHFPAGTNTDRVLCSTSIPPPG